MKKNYKKFKIFPVKRDKAFYTVYVFDDRASMRLFSNQLMGGSNHKFEAATHSYKSVNIVKGKKIPSETLGSMVFYKGGFGIGVVSHEMAHAVNYFFERRKIKFNLGGKVNEDWKWWDEVYAWSLGYMNNQFWKKYAVKPGKERY